jgi:hypothetical protein
MSERITIAILKDEHIEKLVQFLKRKLLEIRDTMPNTEKIIIQIEFFIFQEKPMININVDAYTSVYLDKDV